MLFLCLLWYVLTGEQHNKENSRFAGVWLGALSTLPERRVTNKSCQFSSEYVISSKYIINRHSDLAETVLGWGGGLFLNLANQLSLWRSPTAKYNKIMLIFIHSFIMWIHPSIHPSIQYLLSAHIRPSSQPAIQYLLSPHKVLGHLTPVWSISMKPLKWMQYWLWYNSGTTHKQRTYYVIKIHREHSYTWPHKAKWENVGSIRVSELYLQCSLVKHILTPNVKTQ